MRAYTCIIDRDAVQKTACEKWAADLPILRAIYGDDGAVVVLGHRDLESDRSPEEEYERLLKTYGTKEGGVPWVEYVYGRSLGALEKAMEGDDFEDTEAIEVPTTSAVSKRAARKVPKKAVKKSAE